MITLLLIALLIAGLVLVAITLTLSKIPTVKPIPVKIRRSHNYRN